LSDDAQAAVVAAELVDKQNRQTTMLGSRFQPGPCTMMPNHFFLFFLQHRLRTLCSVYVSKSQAEIVVLGDVQAAAVVAAELVGVAVAGSIVGGITGKRASA
jgi:hypothetical protein